ncbi:MAG: hypothetical protein AAGJ73_16050, partial [Pseudomonadota bacterium]
MVSSINPSVTPQIQPNTSFAVDDAQHVAQATQSSNYNPLGNHNPLSLDDERLLRLGPNDFSAQGARAFFYGLAERGVELGQTALKLPKAFLSSNPVLRAAAGGAFNWLENQTLGRLERELSERVLPNTLDPMRAFEGIKEAATEFEDSSLA